MGRTSSLANRVAWRNGSKAVFNIAFAYSHIVSPTLELSGGFRTNNFAYENKETPQGTLRNTILDGNHMHFVVGSKLKFKRNTILLGIDYGTINNIPNESGFQRLADMDILGASFNDLKKNNISILLTYGFIIDEIKKLRN